MLIFLSEYALVSLAVLLREVFHAYSSLFQIHFKVSSAVLKHLRG